MGLTMKLFEYTAEQLSEMIKSKKCSAAEVTASVFERIEQVEKKTGAYITLTKEQALKQASGVDAKIALGEQVGSLAGIPIGVKDNICTNGIKTTCASKILYNFVPPYNATVIEKLHQSNAVITGKLNMDEFAMGSSCENSYFKKTTNPYDNTRVPGGSSGGSAAAVSNGEAVLALGSDTGGSIRQPASYCGVVGIKPTYGLVSRFGLVAFASSLDQIGTFGRTVKDATLLFDAIKGHDSLDATSVNTANEPIADKLTGDIKGMKIGIPTEYFGMGVENEIKQNVMNAAKQLESLGAKLIEISLPSTNYALSVYYIIACAEASSNLARFDGVKYGYRAEHFENLIDMYERSRSEGFGAEVKHRIMLGTFVLSSGYYDSYYKKAKLTQNQIKVEFDDAFKSCDVLLTPTAPTTAFKIGDRTDDPIRMYAADVCTVPINIAGLPAVSLPCAKDAHGLPIGLQLIGRKFSEQVILNTGYAFEKNFCSFGSKVKI
jgi:aspartyl-tRNA(Asn)/glutamyl-tRNA(Gln) amidotransferase subunit A